MASEEAQSLLSDLAAGKPGSAERIFVYLRPIEDCEDLRENRSLLTKFYPFLAEALTILPRKLAYYLKDKEEVSVEWFTAYKHCLLCLESISNAIQKPLKLVQLKFKLLICFVNWRRWEEGELEALSIFKKLKHVDCNNLYLPNSDPTSKNKSILARTVSLLCKCVACYKPKLPEHYTCIPQIITEFQPWIRVLDKDLWHPILKDLMTCLMTITSYLVRELDLFDSQFDLARRFCVIIITTRVQESHYQAKLCDSLYQIGMQMNIDKEWKQASHVFEFHCRVTWYVIEAKLKEAGIDIILIFFGKWCEGVQSLIRVLIKSEFTTSQLQGVVKSWTEKWTAEEFCATLPGPIPLVEQWVKIQVEIAKHADNGADAGSLLGNAFISLGKEARKKILQQELLFYVQMENENHNFCEKMQTMINHLLKEDEFDDPKYWLEESSSLIFCQIKGSNYCTQYLSQVVKISHGPQLALAYARRSICILWNDEHEPIYEKVIKDVRSALSVWSSIDPSDSSMETGNMMNLLYSILDLLSLKGLVDLNCDIYKVMVDIYTRRGMPLKNLLARLLESRRISHALCPFPIQEEFLNLQEHFSDELKFTEFWLPLVEGFDNSFSQTIDGVEEIASNLILSDTEFGIFSASCIYYDLSEKLVSNAHSIEAFPYAMNAYQLRVKLFRKKFPWSSEGCGGEDNVTGRHLLLDRISVNELFSFSNAVCDLDTCFVSPWKALQCYLESLLQLGIIHEILGNASEAEYFLDRGKSLSCSHSLTLFNIVFSSYLGDLYLKQQRWLSAEKELQSASELLKDIKIGGFCSKCTSILDVSVAANLGVLHQNMGKSLERLPNLYKEALVELYSSKWKMSSNCCEDEGNDWYSDSCEKKGKDDWYSDLQKCVVSSGNGVSCICKGKGCCHCVHEKFRRSGLVINAIKLNWDLVHRRLLHKLLTLLGKYLENDGQLNEACEILLQSISVIVGPSPFCRASRSTFLPDTMGKEIGAERKHLNLFHLLGREYVEDVLCLERATILFNLCLLSLKRSWKYPSNNQHVFIDIPISKVVSWLMLAFVLSREVPVFFQKVSKLLAAIFSMSTSSMLESSLSSSCQDLCGRYWVSFFHQASLGVQFDCQFFIKEVQQHADTKVSLMVSELQKLPSLAPTSVLKLVDFVNNFFGGLPSTAVICLSILDHSYSSVFSELLSCSDAPAWIMVSRLNHNTLPINIVLPVRIVQGDGVSHSVENDDFQWWCPWGFTVVDDVAPNFRSLMEDVSFLAAHESPSFSVADQSDMIHRVDDGLRQLLTTIEDSWFGNIFKYVLLGELVNSMDVDIACEDLAGEFRDIDYITLKFIVIGLVKYGHEGATSVDVIKFLLKKGCLFNDAQDECCPDAMRGFASKLIKAVRRIKRGPRGRSKPMILVPDFDVQMLPWESLPILRNQEVYRMLSIGSILTAYKNERKINPQFAYYLMNPDGSLTLTYTTDFQKLFEDKKLKGSNGFSPGVEELALAVESRDLYIYIGHGSGAKYIPDRVIERLQNCAGALLSGCSSVALKLDGSYVPRGTVLAYLLAGSPFVFGYLWPVLDCETSKSALAILNSWFEGRYGQSLSVGRMKCGRYPYMVGAAQACYGVPIDFKVTK